MNLDLDRVPTCLDEALSLLSSALTQEEKDAWRCIPAARLFELQFKLAQVLRNDWSLEDSNTPLRIYFRNLGLDDGEEVSLLILEAYWRMYNKEPLAVEDLVREYLEEYS